MKQKLNGKSQRQANASKKTFPQGRRAGRTPALRTQRVATLELETLELARTHMRALTTWAGGGGGPVRRAVAFFTEAIVPILENHRLAKQSKMDLKQMSDKLQCRTAELAVANRQLERDIVRRKSVEAALKDSSLHCARLLQDSIRTQADLRALAHKILGAHEAERKTISCELQDEIAQTLLGINVRLLALKKEARNKTKGIKNDIASTQRLVLRSAKSVRQFARELDGRR